MRSPTEALLYPGIGLLETTNLSVGRGTEIPFEVFGAPWLNGPQLARDLNALGLPGVRFVPIIFTPQSSKFSDERCRGVRILVTDRKSYRSVHTGWHIAVGLRRLHPQDWQAADYDRLLGNRQVLDALLAGHGVQQMEAAVESALQEFRTRRRAFLLYNE
jgi:uncharacterized protein YbbC (DUF1343 family)